MCTRLSNLLPFPIKVFSIVPRSMAQLAPISTFSPIITVPRELIRSNEVVRDVEVIFPVFQVLKLLLVLLGPVSA